MEGSNHVPLTASMWRLLGEPALPWRGEDLAQRLGKKALGLVAYLSLAREGAGRDEVARLLWPPTGPSDVPRSRHNLRQCLVALRKVFGPDFDALFEVSESWLNLKTETVAIDVVRLFELEAESQTSPDELLGLCRGPFLRSLVTRAPPFDAWAEEKRAQIAHLAGRMLETAHAEAERRGDRRLAARLTGALAELGKGPATLEPQLMTAGEGQRIRQWRRRAWQAAATLLVSVATLGGAVVLFPELSGIIQGERPDTGSPRIAVLPFTTQNGSTEEKGLANGVTSGIDHGLYMISELFTVTPAPTITQLDQPALVARARKLGVRYLIMGMVAIDGDKVRVDVSCFDSRTRSIVWNDQFPAVKARAFKLQDAITLRILQRLGIEVSSATRNRITLLDDTDNLAAWLAAAKGLSHLIRMDRTNIELAKRYYGDALRLDPTYISAHRGLAWVDLLGVRLGWTADETAALWDAQKHIAAAQAVLASGSPDKHEDGTILSLMGVMQLLKGDYKGAVKDGMNAVQILPGSADTNAVFAHTLTYVGKPREALRYIDKAISLSEIVPAWYRWTKGRALRMAGLYEESVALLQQDYGKGEPVYVHLLELATSLAAAGRIDEARSVARTIPERVARKIETHPQIENPQFRDREMKWLEEAGLSGLGSIKPGNATSSGR